MEEQEWSSDQEQGKETKIINTRQILVLFGNDSKRDTIDNFVAFHTVNKKKREIKELIKYEMIEKLSDEQARQYIEEILGLKNSQEKLVNIPQKIEINACRN